MTDRCANCGRYLNPDGEAFFTLADHSGKSSHVVPCCNEACADQYEAKCLTAINTASIVCHSTHTPGVRQ